MADTNTETIADIIAEARDKYTVRECNQCAWRKCCSKGFGSEECGKFRESIWLKLGIEDGYFTQLLNRLEAAHKRELAETAESLAAKMPNLIQPIIERGIRKALKVQEQMLELAGGDAAAMREALSSLRDATRDFCQQILNSKYNDIMDEYKCRERGLPALLDLRHAIPKANSALAAPPRNCDRPECATTKAAQDVWRKEDGGKTVYYEWLLAPATEKEGGAK